MSYRRELPSGIVIVDTVAAYAANLEEMQRLVYPTLVSSQRALAKHYLKHIEMFPEGQFTALDGVTPVGSTISIRLSEDFLYGKHTFDDIFTGGWCSSHDSEGDWLYGVDVSVYAEYRGRGIARALYQARHETCRALGLKGQYSMGMLNGYSAVHDVFSIDEYYAKVVAKELVDPTVSMQMKIGFEPVGLVHNYLVDPTCGNACVRLVIPTEKDI
jgi:GNAT superfamily N-acetyltransferase